MLTPDFQGAESAIDTVVAARPNIFAHNVETAPRLYSHVRPQADYERSLAVLAYAKTRSLAEGLRLRTKSGFMVGVGETNREIEKIMRDLRHVGCDVLTIGQYLAPSSAHVPVRRYVEPAQFTSWKHKGMAMGFSAVSAGPFVRSSYYAEDM